jgi:ATP-dependent exoDNAse (exonuclease V) beta subunit
MLVNDSATIAVEIPVYLTKEDIAYYRGRGFTLDFESDFITGHIDFLQVRDGYLQILDYKPDARKEKHAHVQLTIYALALARRTNLPLKVFKCAWFDERDYFEFFPLQGVYQPKARLNAFTVPTFRGAVENRKDSGSNAYL